MIYDAVESIHNVKMSQSRSVAEPEPEPPFFAGAGDQISRRGELGRKLRAHPVNEMGVGSRVGC